MTFTYTFKKKPYRHQKQALKKLLSTGWGGALLMQARTGKTKVGVDYASILHMGGKVNRVLIVCPVAAMGVWVDQIEDNVPDEINYRITIWDRKGRKKQPLPKMGDDALDFVIVNYDGFSTPGDKRMVKNRKTGELVEKRVKKGGKYALKKSIKLWQPQLMMLDESHRIKSASAAKTVTILSIAWNRLTKEGYVPYRVIMTGTPWTKKKRPFDLYSQWKFLNPDRFKRWPTLNDFKHNFGRFLQLDGYEKFLGSRNEDRLIKLVHKDAFVVKREDCYDLPPKLPDRLIEVKLQESGQAYDDMAETMVAMIETGEITEASITLVQSLRLRQISGGVVRTTNPDGSKGRLVRIGSEKLRILEDLLEDLIADDEHVIIGCQFVPDIQGVMALCKKLKVPSYAVYGKVDQRERPKIVKDFETCKGPAVYVAQPSASAEAIDLRSAGVRIWYSLTNSWVTWNQFNDRNALNEKGTQDWYLLAGPADHHQYESLLEDDDVGRRILTNPRSLLRDEDDVD